MYEWWLQPLEGHHSSHPRKFIGAQRVSWPPSILMGQSVTSPNTIWRQPPFMVCPEHVHLASARDYEKIIPIFFITIITDIDKEYVGSSKHFPWQISMVSFGFETEDVRKRYFEILVGNDLEEIVFSEMDGWALSFSSYFYSNFLVWPSSKLKKAMNVL